MKRCRFFGWHDLSLFAIPPCECDLFYQAVQEVQAKCVSFRALGTPTLVLFSYWADKTQSGTGLERDLIQKNAKVKYIVMSVGALLRCARYNPVEC